MWPGSELERLQVGHKRSGGEHGCHGPFSSLGGGACSLYSKEGLESEKEGQGSDLGSNRISPTAVFTGCPG